MSAEVDLDDNGTYKVIVTHLGGIGRQTVLIGYLDFFEAYKAARTIQARQKI